MQSKREEKVYLTYIVKQFIADITKYHTANVAKVAIILPLFLLSYILRTKIREYFKMNMKR